MRFQTAKSAHDQLARLNVAHRNLFPRQRLKLSTFVDPRHNIQTNLLLPHGQLHEVARSAW